MAVRDLIEKLEEVAALHGNECKVVVTDGIDDWPFTINIEPDYDGSALRMIVCITIARPSWTSPD